jgi:myosin heavy subunit
VLIAVNPCQQVPLYTPEIAQQYKGARVRLQRAPVAVQPFSLAWECHRRGGI